MMCANSNSPAPGCFPPRGQSENLGIMMGEGPVFKENRMPSVFLKLIVICRRVYVLISQSQVASETSEEIKSSDVQDVDLKVKVGFRIANALTVL